MTQKHQSTPRPQDDYFTFINGDWLARNPIPASESSWGTFYILRDESWAAVHTIIKSLLASDNSSLAHEELLLKQFFASAMNYEASQTEQLDTLRDQLNMIAAIDNLDQLISYLGSSERSGLNHFFSVYVELDDHDSSRQVLRIHQAGLVLPNRDYYLDKDSGMEKIRHKYKAYFSHAASDFTAELRTIDWKTLLAIETRIAKSSWTDVKLRDVEKNYNFYTLDDLKKSFSDFDWDTYFSALGWNRPSDHIVIDQPDFVRAIIELIHTTPLADIKMYLAWRVFNACLPYISEAGRDMSFGFFDTTLNGIKERKPLWKEAVLQADRLVIGEALGKQYARQYFPVESKQSVLSIVEDIRTAYHHRINRLQWMGDATKQRAHTKLDAIQVFIGYPSIWKDLSGLNFNDHNLLHNVLIARQFEHDQDMHKIGQPPAAEQWEMNAHTVNAYHHPNRLEIVFPAAILQPPFFDPTASYAENLGGIGAVIGHEFTHGFDDQGAQFDEHGNVVMWQTDEERAEFARLAQHIVDQADTYEVLPGVHLQGKLVLGEAIADIGGLELALEALSAQTYTEDDISLLLTNFARAECGHTTDELAMKLAKIDPHPPSKFRVNAVVGNVNKFYSAYNVEPADKLYIAPTKRSQIW